jgi:hypothetical protein
MERSTRTPALAAFAALALVAAFGCAPKSDETSITVTDTTSTAPPANTATPDTSAQASGSGGAGTMPVAPATPPDHIEVQHVLIGFAGKIPGKNVTRTQAEADRLAHEILDRARKGEDFDQLVQKYTDDQWPGIYAMNNRGVAKLDPNEIDRDGMVKGFSDVAFRLSVGNVDMSNYDPNDSPYGWHIIKRIK